MTCCDCCCCQINKLDGHLTRIPRRPLFHVAQFLSFLSIPLSRCDDDALGVVEEVSLLLTQKFAERNYFYRSHFTFLRFFIKKLSRQIAEKASRRWEKEKGARRVKGRKKKKSFDVELPTGMLLVDALAQVTACSYTCFSHRVLGAHFDGTVIHDKLISFAYFSTMTNSNNQYRYGMSM
jgi:hypothetical protein